MASSSRQRNIFSAASLNSMIRCCAFIVMTPSMADWMMPLSRSLAERRSWYACSSASSARLRSVTSRRITV